MGQFKYVGSFLNNHPPVSSIDINLRDPNSKPFHQLLTMYNGYLTDASYLESFLLEDSFAGEPTSLPTLCAVPAELEVPDLPILGSPRVRAKTSRKGLKRPTPYQRSECSAAPWRQPANGYPSTLPETHLRLPAIPSYLPEVPHNSTSIELGFYNPAQQANIPSLSYQQTAPAYNQHLPVQPCELTPSSSSTPEPKKKQYRRKRTVFSPAELHLLNEYYSRNRFLNPDLKTEILAKMEVPGNVLVMWFQNKRAKDRASGIVI